MKWLTPATLTLTASSGASNIFESMPRVLKSSWQSPTAVMEVAFVTALVRTVSGLVRFNSTASGQDLSIARAISTTTGMFRRPRKRPPGPTLSPTVCTTP